MTQDRWDALLDRDWSETWETLPEAPELVPRAKTAQLTLRLPVSLLGRIKRVAAARALPYHALARSWIIDGLRQAAVPLMQEHDLEPQTAQLNVKLDQGLLDSLKARAHEMHQPYHRLARQWIEWEVVQAERALERGGPATVYDHGMILQPESGQEATKKQTARITKVVVACDLEDGEVAASESLSWSYGGNTYTLDLCKKHFDEVNGALEGFASAGHSAGRGTRGRRRAAPAGRTARAARAAAAPRGESQAEIREWGRAQGYAVGDRGRIPGEVRTAYESARSHSGRLR